MVVIIEAFAVYELSVLLLSSGRDMRVCLVIAQKNYFYKWFHVLPARACACSLRACLGHHVYACSS